MSDTDYFAKYRAYFVSQKDRAPLTGAAHLPFVTLSRQTGAGAETVAHLLAAAEVTVEEVSAEEAAKYEEIADEIATEDEPDDVADGPERLGDGLETPAPPAGNESDE